MAKEDKFADEIMSDDELDQVTGGNYSQAADDSKFLYDYGLNNNWHSAGSMAFFWLSYSPEVDAGWAKAGITCVTAWSGYKDNKYFINGKEISRDEAYAHVRANFQKIRDHNG